jgi:molecular chaperone GrpE (heat shock protein)
MNKSNAKLYTDPLESIFNEVKTLLLDNGKLKLKLEESQRNHREEKKTLLMNLISLSDSIYDIKKKKKSDIGNLNLLYNMIFRSLRNFNVTPLGEEEYEKIDHNLHLVVETEINSKYEDGKIMEIIKKGFRINDELLRAGEVKVISNKKKEE